MNRQERLWPCRMRGMYTHKARTSSRKIRMDAIRFFGRGWATHEQPRSTGRSACTTSGKSEVLGGVRAVAKGSIEERHSWRPASEGGPYTPKKRQTPVKPKNRPRKRRGFGMTGSLCDRADVGRSDAAPLLG